MNVQIFLNNEFKKRKHKNARFSLRSFARLLEIDATTLGRILKGQGLPSRESVERFAAKLRLNSDEQRELLDAFQASKEEQKKEQKSKSFNPIDDGIFENFFEWYYPIILESLRAHATSQNLPEFLNKNHVSQQALDQAIQQLLHLKLIKMNADNELTKVGFGSTTIKIPTTSEKRKEIQKKYLELAMNAIDEVPFSQRENTTLTVALNKDDLCKISQIMQAARTRIGRLSEKRKDKGDTVYNITMAIYPVL
ncbi:TIGR02147 family protein [Bdellovibrio sp.]|uniref:TIGR02147 family protein n=1 Tax=Bdellovibrio sp. TaxID=28201 RepID=UPI0039E4F99B